MEQGEDHYRRYARLSEKAGNTGKPTGRQEFARHPMCPACGHGDIDFWYCEELDGLRLACNNCGFVWWMEPAWVESETGDGQETE